MEKIDLQSFRGRTKAKDQSYKLSQVDKAKWLRRMSQLIDQGYSMLQTLEILTLSAAHKEKVWLSQLSSQLADGNTLEEAFQQAGFSAHVLIMVSQAEVHGNVALALQKASEWKMKKIQFRKECQKVLTYPLILLLILSVIIYVIFAMVLPQFQYMFNTYDIVLPPATQNMLAVFQWISQHGMLILPLFFSTVVTVLLLLQKGLIRQKMISFGLQLPLLKRVVQVIYSVLFSMQMGFLLQAGIPLHDALQKMLTQSASTVFQQNLKQIEQRILEGNTLGEAIEGLQLFTPELYPVIYYAERNGQLAKQLIHYGSHLEKESIEEWIQKIKWIEPILLCAVGIFIAYLFLSVFAPIMHLIDAI